MRYTVRDAALIHATLESVCLRPYVIFTGLSAPWKVIGASMCAVHVDGVSGVCVCGDTACCGFCCITGLRGNGVRNAALSAA